MDLKSTSREQHRDVFVLSGGANRGAVQVGMMEVLLEHGIVPDALVGTSVGALNAAFMGIRPDRARLRELRSRWMALTTRDIFPGGTLTRVGHLIRQRPYLFSPGALTRLIDDWLPTTNLEDLPTPVRVVTTPLTGDTAVYHRHGNLAQLLLASAAVPAVFPPVHLPASCGHPGPHVDGGVADLVPVSGAADLAPTRVFVLDASVPSRLPRGRTPIDVLVASLGVATRVRPVPDLGPGVAVHHLTTPDRDIRMTDFSNTHQHICDGRAAAEKLIDDLVAVRQQELAELSQLASSEADAALAPAPARRSTRLWDRRNRAA
jgi:NTE family protein